MSEYILGDANAICDVCGFKFKLSKLRKRWDNAMCCNKDWEPRNPLDRIKGKGERNYIRDARVEQTWQFLGENEVQPGDL